MAKMFSKDNTPAEVYEPNDNVLNFLIKMMHHKKKLIAINGELGSV